MRCIQRAGAVRQGGGTMYVCLCKGIRLSEAVESARRRGCSPEALNETWGFDDGDACGRCYSQIGNIAELVELRLEAEAVKAG